MLAAVVLFLTASTIARASDFWSRGPEASDLGTATVRACTEYGPVSVYGFGTTYACTADVRWSDGRTSVEDFPAGQLKPGDVDVEVFEHAGGWREPTSYGVNDSARWYAVGLVLTLALYLAALAAAVVAIGTAFGLVRRPEPGKPKKKSTDEGPVDKADRAAVPRSKIETRVRLLAALSLTAAGLQLLSSIPRNDAPRAVDFRSPWPQIERAWLVTPDDIALSAADFGAALIGAIVALALLGMASMARDGAARVVRYGPEFLATTVTRGRGRKAVRRNLREWEAKRRGQLTRGVLIGGAFLALGGYALVHALSELPDGAPALVVVAGLRDAIVLGALGVILLSTLEPKYDRLMLMLRRHEELQPQAGAGGMGT